MFLYLAEEPVKPVHRISEIEEFEHQLLLVLEFRFNQLCSSRLLLLVFAVVLRNKCIRLYPGLGDRRTQNDSFESPAAAQRHINLPECKGCIGVDDHLVKSQSLAFMNGDHPGKP